jgi:hypothetical protein
MLETDSLMKLALIMFGIVKRISKQKLHSLKISLNSMITYYRYIVLTCLDTTFRFISSYLILKAPTLTLKPSKKLNLKRHITEH